MKLAQDVDTAAFGDAGVPAGSARPAVPLLLLCSLGVVPDLSGALIYPTLPFIADHLAIGYPEVQLLTTAYLLGTALSQPVQGPLSDRFGRRLMLLISLTCVAITSLAAAFAGSLGVLIACRIVEALGTSAALVNARAIAYDTSASEAQAARKISYVVLAMGIGAILAPTLSGATIQSGGWRVPFLLAGGIITAIGVWTLYRLPDTRRQSPSPLSVQTLRAALAALLRTRAFVGYSLILGASMGGIASLTASVPMIGHGAFGLDARSIGMILSGGALVSTASFWLSGRSVGRFGLQGTMTPCLVVMSFLVVITGAVGSLPPIGLLAAAFAAQCALSLINVPSITGTLRVPPALTATAAGFSSAFSLACAGVGSQLTSQLYRGSHRSTIIVVGGFTLLGLLGLTVARSGRPAVECPDAASA